MKYFKRSYKQSRCSLIAVFLAGLLLSGCGGSGNPGSDDDEGIIGTGLLLKGTVSSESRLAENTVEVKSSDGIKTVASVDANGRYQSGSITGQTPYLIRANLGNNTFKYSIGYANGNQITQNLHSYTDAAARNWFSRQGLNIDAEFSSDGPLTSMPTATQYNDTLSILSNIVGPVQDDYGLSGVNIQSADFIADGTGLDRYLINNPVIVNNGQITIIINDPNSNVQSVATSNLSLSDDWAATDTEAPGTPENVRVLQASANEAVVVWQPATDNIGVTNYRVYRDGVDVALTPYPVFTDAGLSPGSTYTYSIVAVDAAGNESPQTPDQTVTLSIDLDTIAPLAPLSLQLNATVSLINISWQHPDISDVALFEVQRATGNATPAELISVPSTFFTDTSVLSGTQYCYQIVAVDSAGNRSPVSQNDCATTSGNAVVTEEVEVTTPTNTDPGPVVVTPNPANCTAELEFTRVQENTTIPAGCYLVNSSVSVDDGINLNVSPGVILKFAAGTRLYMGQGASLTADGRADAPIFFTAQDPTPGYWTGLVFVYSNSSRNILNHVTVEFGGDRSGANLEVSAASSLPSRINISNSTFRNSGNLGIEIDRHSLVDTFSNNTLTGNEFPIKVSAEVAPDLGSDSRYAGNTNDFIELEGSTFDVQGTLQKQDVPYLLDSLSVNGELSIAAGVTAEFTSNARLYIAPNGSLSAVGTASDPVVLTGREKTPGFWQGLNFTYSSSVSNKLEHVIVEYGGTTGNDNANLSVNSASSLPTRLAMNNVVLRESLGDGFHIEGRSILSQFENITSTSNARTGNVDAQIVGSIGPGAVFTGNTEDVLVVEDSVGIDQNESWVDHGVPYSAESINVSETNLVLSQGVELLMQSNSRIYVSSEGSLTVAGTATNPVIITGAEPVPGYWRGILFVYSNSTSNSIDNAVIRHGGSSTTNAGNIALQCANSLVSRLSVSNTLIADSISMGISTSGTSCELSVDGSVTFSNNADGNI